MFVFTDRDHIYIKSIYFYGGVIDYQWQHTNYVYHYYGTMAQDDYDEKGIPSETMFGLFETMWLFKDQFIKQKLFNSYLDNERFLCIRLDE